MYKKTSDFFSFRSYW